MIPKAETETKKCPYCGWIFEVTPRHKNERVLPHCSHGCRIAMEERHVAFEERHCELKEEITAGEMPVEYVPDLTPLADLPQSAEEKIRSFFCEWTRLNENTRVCIALRLRGLPFWSIGELLGISAQAAHKSAKKAAKRSVVLASALNLELELPPVDVRSTGTTQANLSFN
jgi:hypothetical protein